MTAALLGYKLGMTRYFTEAANNIPVTVIKAGPCTVTQGKAVERDGYSAVQVRVRIRGRRRGRVKVRVTVRVRVSYS